GGIGLSFAAIALVLLTRPDSVREPMLAIDVRHDGPVVRSTGARVGDTVVITARADAYCQLRVYSKDRLLAGCPSDARCRSSDSNHEHVLEVLLNAPGNYDAILVVSSDRVLPDQSMDLFVSAAHQANAQVRIASISVR